MCVIVLTLTAAIIASVLIEGEPEGRLEREEVRMRMIVMMMDDNDDDG